MTYHDHIILSKAERLAFRHANLIAHDVGERDHLSHRMLDLNARVHLHEIEATVFIEQKFERARTCIADRLRCSQRSLAHLLTQLRSHHRGRRFFEQLLMPALNRAFALAQVYAPAVFVRHHLDFNVPRTLNVTLDVDVTILECCRGFR